MKYVVSILLPLLSACQSKPPADDRPRKIEVLFLGHNSRHHVSEAYAPLMASALAGRGINVSYGSDPKSLNDENLSRFDVLLLYANHDSITASQERALFEFVESGKGFMPIHAASYCFRNSEEFVELVGAQFMEHGTGSFTAEAVNAEHPVMQELEPFETWDETYVHTMHNDDRTLLMEHIDGERREPWTWVRTHGEGRVFYTAHGHDERTWSHPGFHPLLSNAVMWTASDRVRALGEALSFDPLRYADHDRIPNYEEREPPPKLQQPRSPEASRQYMQVPPEFELELFASEPDIVNPIAMAWDERGRLFVIETNDYPNDIRVNEAGNDVIKIVEDTDGDDRADVKEVVLTGFGTRDTHAGPSSLKYGLDNWVWGTVGYNNFEGVVGGDSVDMREGVYRFTVSGDRFERVTQFTNNTWGLGFSETFDVFGSTANNEHSVFVAIPDRYFGGVPGLKGDGKMKIDGHYAVHPITRNFRQVGVWGGYTASAGHNLYTARDFPTEYWNRIAFVNEPTGHLLHNAVLEPSGSGYREIDGWNLLASADEWVSPVHAEVGPDGAVRILDWYNFIVQHNPTPEGFDTGEGLAHVNPLRDRRHGRIYRLRWKGADPGLMPELNPDDPGSLLDALDSDNMFWRLQGQRLLVERGMTDVAGDIVRIAGRRDIDEIGLNGAVMHALWTLHGLGVLDGSDDAALEAAERALEHKAAGVRNTALQVLPRTEETLAAMLASGVLDEPDLNAHLHAFLAASELPPSAAVGEALYE